MKLIQDEQTLAAAASKAGMDEKTARKYRDGRLPSQMKQERTWRTRKDAFEEVWPEVLEILKVDEAVEAKTVFEYLDRQHPGDFRRVNCGLCSVGLSSGGHVVDRRKK